MTMSVKFLLPFALKRSDLYEWQINFENDRFYLRQYSTQYSTQYLHINCFWPCIYFNTQRYIFVYNYYNIT